MPVTSPPQPHAPSVHRNGGGYKANDDSIDITSKTGNRSDHHHNHVSSDSSRMNHSTNHINDHTATDTAVTMNKEETDEEEIRRIAQLSNTALENMAHSMMNESSQLSISLTQQLSTTTSGQHLLHTSTSLQVAIPSNIHALLQHNTPLLQVCEQYEHYLLHQQCNTIRQQIEYMTHTIQRYQQIQSVIQIVQDLKTVEAAIGKFLQTTNTTGNSTQWIAEDNQNKKKLHPSSDDNDNDSTKKEENRNGSDSYTFDNMLDYANSLERISMMVMTLTETLRYANHTITTTPIASSSTTSTATTTTNGDSHSVTTLPLLEYEQCIVKLSARIRRVEKDMIRILQERFESILQQYTTTVTTIQNKEQPPSNTDTNNNAGNDNTSDGVTAAASATNTSAPNDAIAVQLLTYGHLVRGLILMGRAKDVEMVFTKIAVQPIFQKYISIRLIDQGGTRGECKNLCNVMQQIMNEISTRYQPLLSYTERILTIRPVISSATSSTNTRSTSMDIDLVTTGIWVPLIQTFLTDSTLRMSIFSPGIASIVQTNYQTLVEDCLYNFAERILLLSSTCASSKQITTTASTTDGEKQTYGKYNAYYSPQQHQLSKEQITLIQERIYQHPMTTEFMKRWNLPIYYQLRFGECCTRINTILEQTKLRGWSVTSTTTYAEQQQQQQVELESRYSTIRHSIGFELLLFLELYDTITTFWHSHIFIKPLTNRFLRGTIQVLGRVLAFVKEGMDGALLFGAEESINEQNGSSDENNDSSKLLSLPTSPLPAMTRQPYCWGESETDVASVMWELSLLEIALRQNYVALVCDALLKSPTMDNDSETEKIVKEIITEASEQISPVIDHGWNEKIVNMLIVKCSGPLGAVKGVAATYRMTNRPPPTMSSPFVITILRPLREFDSEFKNRIPTQIGTTWKVKIVSTISDRYAVAVDDLIVTVQRAEESLLKRKGGRATAAAASIRSGGVTMSDGEKVKLQLFLDYQTYVRCVQEVGIDPLTIDGIVKLGILTKEGEALRQVVPK